MVGLKNWLKSSRILQFLSKLVLQNNLIAHYCFFKQITEMSICHCLSVKKRVSVKNVKILEMSDFGNTAFLAQTKVRFRFEPHFAITEATYTRFERPNALLSFPYRVPRSLRMRVPPPFHRVEHCMECGCSGEAEDRDDRTEALRRGHLNSLPLLAGVIGRSTCRKLDIQATDAGRCEPVPTCAGLSRRRRVHSV